MLVTMYQGLPGEQNNNNFFVLQQLLRRVASLDQIVLNTAHWSDEYVMSALIS